MIRTIVGGNWGDEGKGKITDVLAKSSDIVIRYQGGANAGHTIINQYGKFALHLLPSGVFYTHITNIIGPGVALHIESLLKELDGLRERGVPEPNIIISDRAQVVMPYHIDFDIYEEERLGGDAFGSTKSGIAPFYSDKAAKIGIQINHLFNKNILHKRIENAAIQKNILLRRLYHKPLIDIGLLTETYYALGEKIKPMVGDTTTLLYGAQKENKSILLEGQLGSLRDTDHGIYPYTTSSSPLAGFGTVGAGISPKEMLDIICVTKAYSSCVGAGPFVTELFGDEAAQLRRRGGDAGEYGATTGRPRRVGWFDAVATRYGARVQGATEITLTNLDVLGYLDEIPVCVGYALNNNITMDFPVTEALWQAKPVYTRLPGWREDIRGISHFDKLPENCKNYILFIEKQLELPIHMISNGPRREEIIFR